MKKNARDNQQNTQSIT